MIGLQPCRSTQEGIGMSILGINGALGTFQHTYQNANKTQKTASGRAGFTEQPQNTGKADPVSFQAVLDANMGEQGLEDMLKAQYPGLKYHVLDTSKINSSLWQRNDYPFEMFFEDDLDEAALDWKPASAEPSMLDAGVQARLNAARGKCAVVVPPALEEKLENNPELSQSIMKKIAVLIKEQDTVPSSIDSFNITLDEEGNISNHRFSGGGGEIMMPSEWELQKKLQAVLLRTDNSVRLSGNSIQSCDEIEKILQQVGPCTDLNGETDIEEMKKFLDEKFGINIIVTEYSCEKTDSEAESYDLSMLGQYDMNGGRNVIISRKALLRMKKDSAFRQKVYQSREDMPWPGKMTGGAVKSNGVFIHEDGTGGYYLEFDWGDEEEGAKSKKPEAAYADRPELYNSNIFNDDELDTIGFQTDVLLSLAGAGFNHKRIQKPLRKRDYHAKELTVPNIKQ